MKKGQSSIELLIILAFSIAILVMIFSFSSQSVTDLGKQKQIETAQNSVETLKNAVNDVYFQGTGARKKINFIVPSGADEALSGIQGKSIVIRLYGSDIYAKTEIDLSGSIPTNQGGHEIWVTAYDNYVAIGTENLSIDKTSSYVSLLQSDSGQDTITITNNSTETVTINVFESWVPTEVNLALNQI